MVMQVVFFVFCIFVFVFCIFVFCICKAEMVLSWLGVEDLISVFICILYLKSVTSTAFL